MSHGSFRTIPPGIQGVAIEALVVIMDDRLIIHRPFFASGEDFYYPLIDIFLNAPSEE